MQIKNPARCEKCGHAWDFQTDYLGQLHAIHSVNKCVPRAALFEKEDEEDLSIERLCEECKQPFYPKRMARGSQVICSAECRKVRRDRKKAKLDKRGENWKMELLKRLKLPTRKCVECEKMFTISSPFSAKQIVCSSKCRAKREHKRYLARRAA